ncbi:MAG: ABC transporter permease [Vicinamibacterales bacterium]
MLNDLRAAAHFVRRRRGFSAVAAVTLAMGIAANVTVFALVRAVLLTDEPYRASRELFQLLPSDHMARSPFEPSDLEELEQISGIARLAGCYGPNLPTGREHPALLASATEVSEDFFSLLGAAPQLGRTLQPADFEPGVRNAVISFDLWERLGGAPDVVGQRIQLNRQTFTVVGVMPPTFAPPCFDGDVRRQAWIPLDPAGSSGDLYSSLAVIARVSPKESLDRVQAQLDILGIRRAEETGHASYAGMFLQELGLERKQEARPGLLLLQSLAACLLLIACANLGSLFLLDASRRDTELLTRSFLGASPWRIVRQLVLESTVIATVGGTLGAGLSFVIGSAMRSLAAPVVPRGVTYQVGLGDAIVGVAAGIAISLIFATFSAIVAARRARQAGGRTEAHATAGRSVRRFQNALVAIQVALSVVLAIATAVAGLSYIKVATIDLAFDARGVVTSVLYLPSDASSSGRARAARHTVADELRRRDGALGIAFSDAPPFAGGSNWRMALDDANPGVPRSISSTVRKVTPSYFDVLRIPLRRGRPLAAHSESDVDEAVASASFARIFGTDDSLLGRVVRVAGTGDHRARFMARFGGHAYRIVGIAADVSTTWIWQPAGPTLYVGLDRTGTSELSVLVRTHNVAATTRLLPRVIAQTVPDAPEVAAEGLAAIVWRSEAERAFYVASAATFALVAVVIAGVGTYTAVRRMVALRTKEFAIRMSLGAAPNRLQADVLWTALIPVAVGIAGGLLGAVWLARLAESLQHVSVILNVIMRTAPNVAPTAVAVAVGAFLLSAIACWLPARHAASVDPAVLMKGT